MTAISDRPVSSEARAAHLEEAMHLIDAAMPTGPAKIAVLYRLGKEVVRLRRAAGSRICDCCGAPFRYPARAQDYALAHDEEPPTTCVDCRAGPDDEVRTCVRCQQPFLVGPAQVGACAAAGFAAPVHCPPCRFFGRQ